MILPVRKHKKKPTTPDEIKQKRKELTHQLDLTPPVDIEMKFSNSYVYKFSRVKQVAFGSNHHGSYEAIVYDLMNPNGKYYDNIVSINPVIKKKDSPFDSGPVLDK